MHGINKHLSDSGSEDEFVDAVEEPDDQPKEDEHAHLISDNDDGSDDEEGDKSVSDDDGSISEDDGSISEDDGSILKDVDETASASIEEKSGFLHLKLIIAGTFPLGFSCMEISDGIYVTAVQPESPADMALVKAGDRICDVSGNTTSSIESMKKIMKENIEINEYVDITVERATEESTKKQVEMVMAKASSQTTRPRKKMVQIALNSSNEGEAGDNATVKTLQPKAKKMRGPAAKYIEIEKVGLLSEVKTKASEAGLKFVNTVNRTSYFKCNVDGCPYRWKAEITDDLDYRILQTLAEHNHGIVERKDGVSKAIKAIITQGINGNEAVNPEAILQRCRNLGIRDLPTALQVKNCVAYLKRHLVPHFTKMSFADLEELVKNELGEEPEICALKYIINEEEPQKTDFIIIFSCLPLLIKQRQQKHACVDGTWKLVYNNFVVLVFGFVDLNNHVHVTGVAIASSESTNVFKWMFEFYKDNQFTEGTWSPAEIMADNSRAISSAISIVFPEATRRNCYAHVIRACDTKMQSLHFSNDLKATVRHQIHELARCAFENHFDMAAEALIEEWISAGNEDLKQFAEYFRNQYVLRDKNWFASSGSGCRTDNGIEGTNNWIKVIFITRSLPLLLAIQKMKMFLVKARDTNYGASQLRVTNADWIKAHDFKRNKPQIRFDEERDCYYVKRSDCTLNDDEFGDLLDSMELVDWTANDVSTFQSSIAVVSPSKLYDDVLTCNCPVGAQRFICKHALLIEVCVLQTKQFPNIATISQSVDESGRNKAGRPKKHSAALSKD